MFPPSLDRANRGLLTEAPATEEADASRATATLVLLANAVGPMIRAHCAIENSLHWVMDMVFRDDECRVRTDNAPANFAICRHIAYNLTRNLPGKDSIRLRRKTAGWDDEYLVKIIAA